MPRPLDTRLDRVEAKKMAVAAKRCSAAHRSCGIWRAEAAMGAVIRGALARAGVDPAAATRLCLADEAAAALVALPDTPKLPRADDNAAAPGNAHDGAPVDGFAPKILAMTGRFADGKPLDFANVSFAELFAWSLVQPAAE
jgi:hypothetical protein